MPRLLDPSEVLFKPMNPAAILELENVCVGFTQHDVLRNINLNIPKGQTLAVIGESGCGKTVLLKLIIGLLFPNLGSVRFDGRDWSKLNSTETNKQRLRLGFLFQGAALFDSLNIFDNVAFGLRSHQRGTEQEIEQIVKRRVAEVGLRENVLGKKPAELSGGMKKRIGLARALALNPEVMLYDEPTTGLDPIMTDVINELILQTRRNNPVTSIIVTHEMRTVEKCADRVVMFYPLARLTPDEPQILFDGTVQELHACQDSRVSHFVRGESKDHHTDEIAAADSEEDGES
ncbi:MAG: hypothetical protein RL595_1920 [Planctomycetota bacterium]